MKFFSRSSILLNFTISNFLVLKWRSLQYNVKFEKKSCDLAFFAMLLSKTLWTNYHVLRKIYKVHVTMYLYNTDFQDLALSTSKRAAPQTWYQYNTKFEKKNVFINVLIRLLLKTLWKKSFFTTDFQSSYQDLLYANFQDLKLCATKMMVLFNIM